MVRCEWHFECLLVQFVVRFIVLETVTGLRGCTDLGLIPGNGITFSHLQVLRLGGDIPLLSLHTFVARTWQIYLIIGSGYFLICVP